MVGAQFDWWNQDTPEDKLLLILIKEVEELGHLPVVDGKVVSQRSAHGSSFITYFGSLANAYKKVAQILYGHRDLTAPDDLLPSERELSEEEQAKILKERRETYLRKLQELKTPGTLNRWRKEAVRRQYETRIPDGYVVKQIPTKSAHEMIELHSKSARKTSGLFQPSASTEGSAPEPVLERARRAQAQGAGQTQNRTVKDVKDVGGPRRSKDQVLEMLYMMCQHFGKMPSYSQIKMYAKEHEDQQIASMPVFQRTLGEKDTWERQLDEYVKTNGLAPLPVPKAEEPKAEVKKTTIKLNLTSLLLRFRLDGQDYEVEVGFGSVNDAENTN